VLVPLHFTFGTSSAPLLCRVAESLHDEAAGSIELLLQAGAAVDAAFVSANGKAYTALQLASRHTTASGRACLRALLEGGADPCYHTENGMTALHYAAGAGNLDGCKSLRAASSGRALELGCGVRGVTPLVVACSQNQTAAATLLCELGADVNHSDSEGHTALMYAAERDAHLVQYLLERGSSNINAATISGDTALIAAALRGNYASVKLLLERGADAKMLKDEGGSAIVAAATKGHLPVVKLLRRYGCEITAAAADGRTLLMLTCRGGYEELAVCLLREGASVHAVDTLYCTALHHAAVFDDRGSIIKLLLQHGADLNVINYGGTVPLHFAVKCGSLANAEVLIAAGADVAHSDAAGNTALHIAVRDGRAADVKLLLEHGADTVLNTMQCKEWTDCAVSAIMLCNDTAILKLLLTAGADVHAVTSSGDTCLHIAARYNYSAPVVCLLIKAGADMHAVNNDGQTAADVARVHGNTLIERLLNRAAQQA
jgi:uncharacterized protein